MRESRIKRCEYCEQNKEFECITDGLNAASAGIEGNELWFDCSSNDNADERYQYFGDGSIKIKFCPMCGRNLEGD